MNYLTEILGFYRFLGHHRLSPMLQAYWHLLMYWNNRAALKGEDGIWYWPVCFNLPNTSVMEALGFKKHYQVVHLRNQLLRHGLAGYQKHPSGLAGEYCLKPFDRGLEQLWIKPENGCGRTCVWHRRGTPDAPLLAGYINGINNKSTSILYDYQAAGHSPAGFNLLPPLSDGEKAAIEAQYPEDKVARFQAMWAAREKKAMGN